MNRTSPIIRFTGVAWRALAATGLAALLVAVTVAGLLALAIGANYLFGEPSTRAYLIYWGGLMLLIIAFTAREIYKGVFREP